MTAATCSVAGKKARSNLVIINQALPDVVDVRYCGLIEARANEILTAEEHRDRGGVENVRGLLYQSGEHPPVETSAAR